MKKCLCINPLGYKDSAHPHYVCKLDKAIYGLKQAPRAWYARLCSQLIKLGFTPSKGDTSLFYYNKGGHVMFVLIYVDDIVVASSSDAMTRALLRDLEKHFALKDLGNLHYFLGIEVKRSSDALIMSQTRYALDILKRSGTDKRKPVDTPMSVTEKLSVTQGSSLGPDDSTKYKSLVGAFVTPIFKDKNRMHKRLMCAPGNSRTHKLTNYKVSSQCLLHNE
jgi:histone deacetylase 1/2